MDCIKRCPAGAIAPKGHDKIRCRNYIRKIAPIYEQMERVEQRACGLCQTGVLCESRIPV